MIIFAQFLAGVAAQQVRADAPSVYEIRTLTDDGEIRCTSTLIKQASDKCSLVTNYHCVPIDETQHVFSISGNTAIEIQVLKRSEALDLAELSLSPEAQQDCATLDSLMMRPEADIITGKSLRVKTVGFVNGVQTTNYSDDLAWGLGNAASDVLLYRHGPLPSEIFYQINRLNVIPGMSGGVVSDLDGETIGFNSQLIPFQKIAFVIPIQEVLNFLQNGGPNANEMSSESNSHEDSGANSHGNGGANSHGNGGANSHGDGGANSHGNGGVGIVNTNFDPQDPMFLFREPDEGVPIAPDSSTILLGFDGKQIDGVDDYYIKYFPVKDQGKHTLVTRDANDYPEESIRKNLLSRLDGIFRGGASNASFQNSQHSILERNANAQEGFVEAFTGAADTEIDVDSKSNLITFYFWRHSLTPPGVPFPETPVSAWVLVFNTQMGADSKTINLTSGDIHLSCDNKNYLKLICRMPGVELSLSANQAQPQNRQLSYRLAYAGAQGTIPSVDYHFGMSTQESDTGKARKFAQEMAKQSKGIISLQ
jgi:S1-C subfamily serine protease